MSYIHDSNFYEGTTQLLSLSLDKWSLTRPWLLSFAEKRITTKTKWRKQVKDLLGGEEYSMLDRHTGHHCDLASISGWELNEAPFRRCRLRPPEISPPKHLALKVNGPCIHRIHKTIANEEIVLNGLHTSKLMGV